MLFYQRYSLEIEKVTQWDDHGLVVHFPGYVIADYADEVDQVWYYDTNTFELINEQRSPQKSLNAPERQAITSRHAMLSETKNNIVRLQLDAVNLLYSHDFICRVKNLDYDHTGYNGGGLV